MFLLGFILYGTLPASWTWLSISFSMLGKFSTIISSKIFSYPLFFSSGIPIIQMLVHLILFQRSLRLSLVLFILFTLFCSLEVISTILSSSSLIRSSASDILLLIPSRLFLISVIVFLLFNSSRSLLIDSYIFSILLSRFLIIFTIILNYFSGSLPISSSFIWISVFLVCSIICVVFLCLFIISFLTYCVWGLLYPDFKTEFFLPFGFFPPKVGSGVCVSFV